MNFFFTEVKNSPREEKGKGKGKGKKIEEGQPIMMHPQAQQPEAQQTPPPKTKGKEGKEGSK
jgi:hypothetical protein